MAPTNGRSSLWWDRIACASPASAASRPPTTKAYLGAYRNSMTFVLTGLDIAARAETAERTLRTLLGIRA